MAGAFEYDKQAGLPGSQSGVGIPANYSSLYGHQKFDQANDQFDQAIGNGLMSAAMIPAGGLISFVGFPEVGIPMAGSGLNELHNALKQGARSYDKKMQAMAVEDLLNRARGTPLQSPMINGALRYHK